MTDLLDELRWRGVVAHATDLDALRASIDAGTVTFYVGFDPTAPSLHIGSLLQLVTARRLQQAGLRPLLLVGGATGLIGDPKQTGERPLNDAALVGEWVDRLRAQVAPFVSYTGDNAALVVNNLEWTEPMSAIALLRDVGKHFSVNRMLDREAVAARLATTGISFTEFSYVLLQSNDYLELYRRHGCTLQLGGSDQWGNITAGCDLIRRVTGVRTHALATVLVTKADGTKFGKTEAGTIWLDPAMTSPYAFFQYWLNVDDRDAAGYLRLFTSRSQEEIGALEAATRERPAAREAQRTLARDLTDLVHGPHERARVEAAAAALFGRGELADLDQATLEAALAEVPTVRVQVADARTDLVDLLVATGLCASRGAARRTLAEGGVYANNVKIPAVGGTGPGLDTSAVPAAPPAVGDPLHPAGLLQGRWLVLRRGKRTVAAVELAPTP